MGISIPLWLEKKPRCPGYFLNPFSMSTKADTIFSKLISSLTV
jgi:hypothetical protein